MAEVGPQGGGGGWGGWVAVLWWRWGRGVVLGVGVAGQLCCDRGGAAEWWRGDDLLLAY